jgi:hypothetical protein
VEVIEDEPEIEQPESDPIYFLWQRGEATKEEWTNKVLEIKARYPKPE